MSLITKPYSCPCKKSKSQKVKMEKRGRRHSSVVEQVTFNDKVEGSIPSVFRERRGRGRKGMERKRGVQIPQYKKNGKENACNRV